MTTAPLRQMPRHGAIMFAYCSSLATKHPHILQPFVPLRMPCAPAAIAPAAIAAAAAAAERDDGERMNCDMWLSQKTGGLMPHMSTINLIKPVWTPKSI